MQHFGTWFNMGVTLLVSNQITLGKLAQETWMPDMLSLEPKYQTISHAQVLGYVNTP